MALPPCPFLPGPRAGLDWRLLHAHRQAARRSDFYLDCLEYGHALWLRGRPAPAILCLNRAFAAELSGEEAVLSAWPLPYAALAWFLRHAPPSLFLGNPRVHFQHYAVRIRMNQPQRERRRWRAWACGALARAVLPRLPGDARIEMAEPSEEEIGLRLGEHGFPGEPATWRNVLAAERANPIG